MSTKTDTIGLNNISKTLQNIQDALIMHVDDCNPINRTDLLTASNKLTQVKELVEKAVGDAEEANVGNWPIATSILSKTLKNNKNNA
jgi:hypothetical protein